MAILKNRNRTLLEVDTGVLVLAFLATLAGMLLPFDKWGLRTTDWHLGIWMAAILTVISYLHMHRCLDKALDFDEGSAQKMIFRGYLIRYVVMAVILVGAAVTQLLNPLVLCLGYLVFMKVAAYMQPYTHRFYNYIFHEEDPVPEPLVEETKEVNQLERGNP